MLSFRRYAVFAAFVTGVPLLLHLLLVAVLGGTKDLQLFVAAAEVAALLVLVYWAPFVILVGAPAFAVLRGLSLQSAIAACIAIAASVGGAAVLGRTVDQCVNSNWVHFSVRNQLDPLDAPSFKRVRTLDDDFDDDRTLIAITNYCPHWFEYSERGQVKHVSIHGENVFHGSGPVR